MWHHVVWLMGKIISENPSAFLHCFKNKDTPWRCRQQVSPKRLCRPTTCSRIAHACSHEWNTFYYRPTPLSPRKNIFVFITEEEINIYGRNRRNPYKCMQHLQKQNPKRIKLTAKWLRQTPRTPALVSLCTKQLYFTGKRLPFNIVR